MTGHLFKLQPYQGINSRHNCPCCGKPKSFSRYIDTQTGEQVHSSVGKCNREINCGHHYTPKQYFNDNPGKSKGAAGIKAYLLKGDLPVPKFASFISAEAFNASLKAYESNHFVKFLNDLFGIEVTYQLIAKYFIGSSKHWAGATLFWQIDTQGKIRTGKIMLYSAITGKRIKEPTNHITWAHTALKLPEYVLQQCFFGEHLLRETSKPVAIVESEKTAVIASVYLPQFVWLAAGGLSNLNSERFRILQGRNAILFPDLKGFDKWSIRAKELSAIFPGTTFKVSDLLECKATESEMKQGLDLADYLIRFNYKEFILPEALPIKQPQDDELRVKESFPQTVEPDCQFRKLKPLSAASWDHDIAELERYFDSAQLPNSTVKLDESTTIKSVSGFIDGHLSSIKAKQWQQHLSTLS